ncbi:hypothetical protein Bbelb_189340 [Branchiostoma belcheri]|nr:hypothetical protein Bbelb_189340 [Branchiostoma belcheri]
MAKSGNERGFFSEIRAFLEQALENGGVPIHMLQVKRQVEGRSENVLGRSKDCPWSEAVCDVRFRRLAKAIKALRTLPREFGYFEIAMDQKRRVAAKKYHCSSLANIMLQCFTGLLEVLSVSRLDSRSLAVPRGVFWGAARYFSATSTILVTGIHVAWDLTMFLCVQWDLSAILCTSTCSSPEDLSAILCSCPL